MKKSRYSFTILLCVLLSAIFLAFASACTRVAPLAVPTGFNFDENFNMYWTYVPGARTYTVKISGVENGFGEDLTSHVTHVSLEHLAEGDYEIRVMATGGTDNEAVSPWSEAVAFHRDHESGLVFTPINGNAEYAVSGIGTAAGDIVIEDNYRGKPVTAIAEDAFRGRGGSKIESVVIGSNVRTIGSGAFYNCTNLTSVVIPESVTSIGANLFQGCTNLKTVSFPDGITAIPQYTFAYCRALDEFKIGENVTSVGESAFYNCSALKSAVIPDSVTYIGQHAFDTDSALETLSVGNGVRTVDEYAFYNCSALTRISFGEGNGEEEELVLGKHSFDGCTALESVVLPERLVAIGDYSFYRCSALAEANIPQSVVSVGAFAFRDTAIFSAQGEIRDDGYVYTKEGCDGFIYVDDWIVAATDQLKSSVSVISAEDMQGVVGIADQTFVCDITSTTGGVITVGAPSLLEVTLAKSVKYIGVYAFYKCTQLNSFVAEEGSALAAIGDRAFQECENLRNIRFRNGLRDIGSYAFYKCVMLSNKNDLIPESVERVGTYAFYDTAFWQEAEYTDGIVYAGSWAVGFNANVTDATLRSNLKFRDVTGVSDFAFYNNADIQTIEGLSGARRIGRGAFFGCSSLSMITLNDNLTEIADNTFSGCTSLFLAKFPINLRRIGLRAFYNCTLLDAVDLSETMLTEIGDMAFYGCYNVKSLKFGSRLEDIGESAFYGLTQISGLEIPNSVKNIGMHAFANCEGLESLTLGGSLENLGSGCFQNCAALKSVKLPNSLKTVSSYAFYLCPNLSEIDFGSGIESIGNYAFAGSAIESVVLPAGLKTVGDYAFKNCKKLVSAVMCGTPSKVGAHAFYGSPALTLYSVADGESGDWSARWNSSFRPVLWSCTLGEGGYVISFTPTLTSVSNMRARGGFSAPTRKGYDFAGWAVSPEGEVVYSAKNWTDGAPGTTLYAVWKERAEG